jgi:predicted amidohydrolase
MNKNEIEKKKVPPLSVDITEKAPQVNLKNVKDFLRRLHIATFSFKGKTTFRHKESTKIVWQMRYLIHQWRQQDPCFLLPL